MKKKFLLGIVLLSSGVVFGQTSNTMTGRDARIGIKGGVNLARMHVSGDASGINNNAKDNVGFNFTVFGDFGVGNNFFVQPGISLQTKGAKFQDGFDLGDVDITGTNTTNVLAAEIPVNAVFRIPTGQSGAIQINAGPYIGVNIAGKRKSELSVGSGSGTDKTNLKFGNGSGDDLTRLDYGANFGLSYRFNSGFLIGGNYGLGLNNLIPKDQRNGTDAKMTNRVLSFSIGYSF